MISSKDLTTEQVESIKAWAAGGAQLSDIQVKLKEECGLNVTYMDTRFLVLDLGVELQNEEQPEESDEESGSESSTAEELNPVIGGGAVTVELDQVTRPGAMVSGKISFSDGEKGMWFIDQMGRPGLDTDTPGYKPSEEDLIEFEKQLRDLMTRG